MNPSFHLGRVASPHAVATATVEAPPQLKDVGAVGLVELARALDGFREWRRDVAGNFYAVNVFCALLIHSSILSLTGPS